MFKSNLPQDRGCNMNSVQPAAQQPHALQLQRKLDIGPTEDGHEQQAEAVADQIIKMPATPAVQRKCAGENKHGVIQRMGLSSFIQRKESGSGTVAGAAVSQQINSSRGQGNTMDTLTASFMESRFGTDFSGIKIHTDHTAIRMSRELNAHAFTVGNDIYFNEGKYNPSSTEGKHLLAHELTHTVQQQGNAEGSIQRMLACPLRLNSSDPVPAGFKPYYGNPYFFHCGFRGILEDKRPTPEDPMNECFYDETGALVTENHPFAGCRGTPDYYDSETEKLNHFARDPGGIVHAGGPALLESIGHPVLSPLMDLTSYLERNIRQLYGAP
jgi:hypothetical protein